MERMTLITRGALVLLTSMTLGGCQDMVLRDTVVQKVVEAQNPPAKDGRLTLEYNAAVQAFGSTFTAPTAKAGTSTVLHFTIRNTGLTNLTGNAVSVVNPTGNGTFAVTSQPASPIVPGGASNFDLTFNADATTGTAGAVLRIVSNDVDHPTFTVTLAGKSDGTAPTGTLSINGGAAATNALGFALSLTGADTGGAALTQMQFSTDGSNYSAAEAFSTTKSLAFPASADGTKTVYARLIDSVGNVSAAITDTIVLDTTKPTASFSVTNVTTGASKSTNVSVTFNEAMLASSIAYGTNAVQLLLPNGAAVPLQATTTGYAVQSSTNLILRPASNLLCATTYTVKVTTTAKDAVGNAINAYTSTFTTEDDVYENTYTGTSPGTGNENNSSYPTDHAFDLTVSGADSGNFFDSTFAQSTNTGGLAILKDPDTYKITITAPFKLHVRAYFTNAASATNPATDAAAPALGTNSLVLYVSHASAGLGAVETIVTNAANDQKQDFDISGLSAGVYYILIYNNSAYTPQTYNLYWYAEPGI